MISVSASLSQKSGCWRIIGTVLKSRRRGARRNRSINSESSWVSGGKIRSVMAALEGPAATAAAPTANAPKLTRAVRRELSIVIRVSFLALRRPDCKLVVIVRDPEHRLLLRFVADLLGQDAGFFGSLAPVIWVIEVRGSGHGAISTSLYLLS